jgi:hypothetical protein
MADMAGKAQRKAMEQKKKKALSKRVALPPVLPSGGKSSLADLAALLKGKKTAQEMGKKWDADINITDYLGNPQTPRVVALVAKYAPHVIAYHLYSPFGHDSYGLELQFGNEEAAGACLEEYEDIPE